MSQVWDAEKGGDREEDMLVFVACGEFGPSAVQEALTSSQAVPVPLSEFGLRLLVCAHVTFPLLHNHPSLRPGAACRSYSAIP